MKDLFLIKFIND